MKASELRRILENYLGVAKDDFEVVIRIRESWVGPTPSAEIKRIDCGFDWDKGKLLILPDRDLKLKNPSMQLMQKGE